MCACGVLISLPAHRAFGAFPAQPDGYVTDQARVIAPQDRARIEALLAQVERQTSAEIAVVTVSSLDNDDINDAAVRLFHQWGIGKKGKDDGVLFLIAPNERKMRIEVGYGLESVLTDADAGRIRDESVLPLFRAGDLSRGILSGTLAIVQKIAPGTAGNPENGRQPQPLSNGQAVLALLFFILMIVFIIRHPFIWLFFGGFGGYGGGGGGGGFEGFGGGGSGGGGASGGW
jgi:uncharacterized protein